MSLPQWPATVRGSGGRVLRDGYTPSPPNNILRTEMDQGAKTRRRSTARRRQTTFRLRLPMAEFAEFETFILDTCKDGTLWFLWQPPDRPYLVQARCVGQDDRPYRPSPAPGHNMFVDMTVEFFDRAVTV